MELKEGMYIRTKLNDFCNMVAIRKIDEIDYEDDNKFWIDDYIIDTFGDEQNKLSKEDVDNVSDNPIDLIEIGDYVNGYLVTGFDYQCSANKKVVFSNVRLDGTGIKIPAKDIKSIVTKEQFNSVKYEVE